MRADFTRFEVVEPVLDPGSNWYTTAPGERMPIAWADLQPAVTWAGRLGLKERWEHRDDPEYQEMLRKMKVYYPGDFRGVREAG